MPDSGTVVLAGGSGYLGGVLSKELEANGYEPRILSRHAQGDLRWDGEAVGDWARHLNGAAAVINLAGAPVTLRNTASNRKLIVESRVRATRAIGEAIQKCASPPSIWLNASAVGFYGDRGDEVLKEQSAPGTGFLAETSVAWENAMSEFNASDTVKAVLRIGFVLGRDGGALPQIAKFAKLGLGGSLGNGKQWVPWIHEQDLARLVLWMLGAKRGGVYNGCAPEPVRNADLMMCVRAKLHRPWSPPAPAFALELLGRVMTPNPALGLISTRAVPMRALKEGFRFEFNEPAAALDSLL